MLRSDLFGFVGMNADAGVNPVVIFGVRKGGIEFFGAGSGADGQQGGDAGMRERAEHGFAVVRELREIDVGVGVDEFHFLRLVQLSLFQARADFHVFQETGENGAAFGADRSRDDHSVRFDAAKFARSEIGDHGYFAADQFFRLVVLRDAGADLADFRADVHGEL